MPHSFGLSFLRWIAMHITRPDGNVVEIDDADEIRTLLMRSGWAESTEREIERHNAAKNLMIAQTQASDDSGVANTVFYQTVSSSPDGYGMSRDLLKTELFGKGIMLQEEYKHQKVGLLYSYPNSITAMQTDIRVIMTMFESDSIPEDWPEYLTMADEVIVPSKWCSDVFAKAGIATTVVPLGYNDRVFTYVDRDLANETKRPFTFIHYDSMNVRKGFSEVFEAFTKEFKKNEPVRIILKTTMPHTPIPIMKNIYPNIDIVTGKLTEGELKNLLGTADCMVYPSMGEGFGITPLEAMATGLPTIVPNAHGISEYFNSNYMLECKVGKMVPGMYQRFKGQYVGEMTQISVPDLRKQMRYAYNHQAEMHELGKKASGYVKKYTYQESAAELAKVLIKWQEAETIKRNDSKYLQVGKI